MTEVLWSGFWFLAGGVVGTLVWSLLHAAKVGDEYNTPWEPTIYPDIETRLYHGHVESRRQHRGPRG